MLNKTLHRTDKSLERYGNITISGRFGDDARHYQIRDVKRAIEMVSDEQR